MKFGPKAFVPNSTKFWPKNDLKAFGPNWTQNHSARKSLARIRAKFQPEVWPAFVQNDPIHSTGQMVSGQFWAKFWPELHPSFPPGRQMKFNFRISAFLPGFFLNSALSTLISACFQSLNRPHDATRVGTLTRIMWLIITVSEAKWAQVPWPPAEHQMLFFYFLFKSSINRFVGGQPA